MVGHLDDSSQAAHPNCMYMWMNYVISPKVNAQVAEWFGEAPAQSKACDLTSDPKFCDKYHAADPEFWKRVYYWNAGCGLRRRSRRAMHGLQHWVAPGPRSRVDRSEAPWKQPG